MDEHYEEHRKMANEINQPNMCYPRDDIFAFSNRPVLEYADSLQNAIKEEVPMVLLDLMQLPKNNPIIADVLFTTADIKVSKYYLVARKKGSKIADVVSCIEKHFGLLND